MYNVLLTCITAFFYVNTITVGAWYDATHIAVMQASNAPYSSCLAIAPDVLSIKLTSEAANHYSSINKTQITAKDVLEQTERYNQIDKDGHLYGAIIVSSTHVYDRLVNNVRPDYYYSFLAHYVGDLSQPLHNSPYDAFNRFYHNHIDGLVNDLPNLTKRIIIHMDKQNITNNTDIVNAVVTLANDARAADRKLRQQGLLHDDALKLLGKSASLLYAINIYFGIFDETSIVQE